ncbi:MAG: amidohydrolase [Spirochaetales bacterium]|jgi:amidohydrolase|nr:amidohydrolase [Spirochaetales bacterium]
MNDIKEKIKSLSSELIDLRRHFHRNPEIGFAEFKTQKTIINYLKKLDLDPSPIAGTGVVATIKGAQAGRTILLRSDMDALPVCEQTGLPFKSECPGVMHACGHDGHMAMLLVATRILFSMRQQLAGSVKILFQPNEEVAGAWKVVVDGVMSDPKVDAVFGMHLWSQCSAGHIDIVDGPQMAASHYFNLSVKGRGGHAGFAHQSIDPIYVSTLIVQAVQGIQTRQVNALDPAVIMFTKIQAGSNSTIIPEQVEMEGSIRFLFPEGKDLLKHFEKVVAQICQAYDTTYELSFKLGNGLLSNDPLIAKQVRLAGQKTVGTEKVSTKLRTMAGEDFSAYLEHAPGAFAFVGIHNPEKNVIYPHHHPKFDIDEDALAVGTELYIRTALQLLDNTPLAESNPGLSPKE